MTTAEILRHAMALIEQPEHWTKGEYWRDANGNPCTSRTTAVCWCAIGAVVSVTDDTGDDARVALGMLLNAVMGSGSIHRFNDTHTHAEVIDAFRRAIALAEGDAP